MHLGIDIGSTTVKIVVLDNQDTVILKKYVRHKSKAREITLEILKEMLPVFGNKKVTVAFSGSAAMSIAQNMNAMFVQEVYASKQAIKALLGDIDVAVELGGEDAKILFLSGGSEERMNGTCAGGTGAFIDQMASLMNLSISKLDELSQKSSTIYNIASRCGVFAKSDIQPLLNQGATKEDISMSIYQAIVNQTISGLAQGRKITGKVAFLGGPLTFLKGLRQRFKATLNLSDESAVFPENSEYFVAIGAALSSKNKETVRFDDFIKHLQGITCVASLTSTLKPLFESNEEYEKFSLRHASNSVELVDINSYSGNAYLGIDCGSTTTKLALIDEQNRLLYSYYAPNKGEPLVVTLQQLGKIYSLLNGRINLAGSCVTGYGEEHIKDVLGVDFGLVETVAHLYSAKHFNKDVDFIIDIGGQDIKCFKLKNGIIDSIMLNEACSSGCGSFINSFSEAMGYTTEEFTKKGLFSKNPVNLGSRCTVFMNSSVKQAQNDGASVEDISAGLSISVVKNAVYKVIRANKANDLGKHIVAQGGTFLNDAVLRAFEKELGADVVRPNIAGLMGAYGAALYAKSKGLEKSKILSKDEIDSFEYQTKTGECKGCSNNCKLIITLLKDGRKCISGNRCEKMIESKGIKEPLPNGYDFKMKKLLLFGSHSEKSGKIGIPMGLNMYENLPFWHTLFSALDFNVILSDPSSRDLYSIGQHTIPSDTVCYPAKLMHGHIISLLNKGVKNIFYPCLPYNFDENIGDNNYNCPVVSYYPELIKNNVGELENANFFYPYLAPHAYRSFIKQMTTFLEQNFAIDKKRTVEAVDKAYKAYYDYKKSLYDYKDEVVKKYKNIILLCGRPYHADPEINHGIAQLLNTLGFAVITEDMIEPKKYSVNVLNQWTYHSRMYNAANYALTHSNVNVVQIVSFGCGLDAITADEIRDILENKDRIYTQIKIDEINNLGAAKIRLRSLKHVIEN